MVTAVAGLIGAVSALVVSLFSLRKTQAETVKLKAETEQIRRETADIGSKAANAESIARLAHQTSSIRKEITLYDSRSGGFRRFDFEPDSRDGAAAELTVASEEGDAAGVKRRFRVRCRVRAREAEHTFLLTLEMAGAPMGEYLGQRRHRISPGVWTDIDDYFDPSFSANCRLRLEDRSVSAAPSRLEIRDFVVTEHEPPSKLMPSAVPPRR